MFDLKKNLAIGIFALFAIALLKIFWGPIETVLTTWDPALEAVPVLDRAVDAQEPGGSFVGFALNAVCWARRRTRHARNRALGRAGRRTRPPHHQNDEATAHRLVVEAHDRLRHPRRRHHRSSSRPYGRIRPWQARLRIRHESATRTPCENGQDLVRVHYLRRGLPYVRARTLELVQGEQLRKVAQPIRGNAHHYGNRRFRRSQQPRGRRLHGRRSHRDQPKDQRARSDSHRYGVPRSGSNHRNGRELTLIAPPKRRGAFSFRGTARGEEPRYSSL